MPRDARVYLLDAIQAGELIQQFISGRTAADYYADQMLHSAVERQFEVLGEALRQLGRAAPELAAAIPSFREVVAFRNQLAHGYFAVQHEVVWVVATQDVSVLVRQLRQMLDSYDDE